jgi:RHH-type transcriptional regulator, rel operon repressor / antitoxin RelB
MSRAKYDIMHEARYPRISLRSSGYARFVEYPFLRTIGCASCSHCVHAAMCYYVHIRTPSMETMPSTTFTVRVEPEVKKRLEKLAKSTGRTRSFLAAEALNEYLDVNEWQVAGVKRAMASLDRGEGVPHQEVKDWVNSWGRKRERTAPKRSAT